MNFHQKENLKQMLGEATKLLCNNSLLYDKDVKIQAMFGITIDSKEVLLFGLNEAIEKPKSVIAKTADKMPEIKDEKPVQVKSEEVAAPSNVIVPTNVQDEQPPLLKKESATSTTKKLPPDDHFVEAVYKKTPQKRKLAVEVSPKFTKFLPAEKANVPVSPQALLTTECKRSSDQLFPPLPQTPSPAKVFQCKVCRKSFKREAYYERHVLCQHTEKE